MAKLVIIPEDRLLGLVDDAVRGAVANILREATSIDIPLPVSSGEPEDATPPSQPVPPPSQSSTETTSSKNADGETPSPGERRYVIGRANGQYTYADVVAMELPRPLFSLDEAWKAIENKIDTDSPRARGSARRSLDTDERYERVPDKKGLWYRRVDMEQLSMNEEEDA